MREPRRGREQEWAAALLAGTAGAVDAIGFVLLAHLFTAHMSGNSAALGAYAGQRQWREAARRAFPIPVFVAGVFLGAVLVETALRRGARAPLSRALALEALLLVLYLADGLALDRRGAPLPGAGPAFLILAGLPALAMGVQNATLRRARGRGVRTTYVSGMLTNFAEEAAAHGLWLRARTRGRGWRRLCLALRVSPRRPALRSAGLHGSVWLAFALGAGLGSLAESRGGFAALALPLAGLAAVIVWDLVRSLDAESRIEEDVRNS